MNKNKMINSIVMSILFGISQPVFSVETTQEKANTATNEAADGVKRTYRKMKDQVCEMNNGKMECVGKKLKHKTQNTSDRIKTKSTEIKDKID